MFYADFYHKIKAYCDQAIGNIQKGHKISIAVNNMTLYPDSNCTIILYPTILMRQDRSAVESINKLLKFHHIKLYRVFRRLEMLGESCKNPFYGASVDLDSSGHNMFSLFARAAWKWLRVSQENESNDIRVSRWWQNFHLFMFMEETVGTTNDAIITGLFVLFVWTLCLQWELILLTIKEQHWNQRSCHWL